jgi:hypothetical protein
LPVSRRPPDVVSWPSGASCRHRSRGAAASRQPIPLRQCHRKLARCPPVPFQGSRCPDTAANRLKAIRGALRDLLGGAPVDPAELARPLRFFPDLLKEISRDDPFRSSVALAVAQAFVSIEADREKERRTGKKNSNQFTRRPAPPALNCPDVI